MSDTNLKAELTEQETDLYDRQIRLWGLESQKKLRAADILLIGVRALGAEIAKNVLLSGVKSLTFLDSAKVCQEDVLTNFLLPRECINENIAESALERARNLNPMVQIVADSSNIEDKDETFYKKFTLIIATTLPTKQLISINQICRKHGIQFLCGDVFGLFGYTFSDFQIHEFCEEVSKFTVNKKRKHSGKIEKPELKTVTMKKSLTYIPLQDALGVHWTSEEQKKTNKLSSWYFLTRVLLNFRDKHNRNPSSMHQEKDMTSLKEIRDKLFETLGLGFDKLPDNSLEVVFGEVVPVAAIIGGVLAQEVIRAISHSEGTINNMFFFDPDNFSGKIECVGN